MQLTVVGRTCACLSLRSSRYGKAVLSKRTVGALQCLDINLRSEDLCRAALRLASLSRVSSKGGVQFTKQIASRTAADGVKWTRTAHCLRLCRSIRLTYTARLCCGRKGRWPLSKSRSQWFAPVICDRSALVSQWAPTSWER